MPLANDAAAVFDASGGFRAVEIDPGHPEVSGRVLFGKMHYEGYTEPEYVYQSTGTAASEPKYSLVPLVFGTIKATVFAMLFATPLAVLAAVYTSEFLHPSLRKVVKPSVELMASLPSVVLGFIAAVVAAPLIRTWLPGVLVGFLIVPLTIVMAGLLWQMLPVHMVRRDRKYLRMAMITLVLLVAGWASSSVGGFAERLLFVPTTGERLVAAGSFEVADPSSVPSWVGSFDRVSLQDQRRLREQGLHLTIVEGQRELVTPIDDPSVSGAADGDLRTWLDGAIGGAWPGWFLLMAPIGFGLVWIARSVLLGRRWANYTGTLGHSTAATMEFVRFVVSVALALGAAGALAGVLTAFGLDPRDSLFGTFTQRNTLVVGLIMGFAVVPIIFTISEDAMASVPASLRTASLGAGATKWQTAVRIVMPVAGSGIFSAIMIGLGRAVGETMIVLMATGNTPELSLEHLWWLPHVGGEYRVRTARSARARHALSRAVSVWPRAVRNDVGD
jgi:phosphate transport system permease protein